MNNPPTHNGTAVRMILPMVFLGLACALLIALVYDTTMPYIRHNKQQALLAAIDAILPGATTTALQFDGRAFSPGNTETGGETMTAQADIRAGYRNNQLSAFVIAAEGMGYQDKIRLIYVFDPHTDTIAALSVLESRETPGLGSRIHDDPAFLGNFKSLPVFLDPQQRLLHPLKVVKRGRKKDWEIDAITGATVSSKAVARILNVSLQRWLPRLKRYAKDFNHGLAPP